MVLVRDAIARARVSEAVRGVAEAVFCGRVADVRGRVQDAYAAGGRLGAVVLEPRDLDGTPVTPTIAELRLAHPDVPILAYCAPAASASADILAAARAGVSGILLRGHDDVGVALRGALRTAEDDCAARRVLRVVAPVLRRGAREVVEHCLLRGREPLPVAAVALAMGVHRKTLVNRFAALGLPEPRVVITWCRLCLVAYALEDPGVTVERVAMDFGFGSAPALRNLCKRHTGLRAGDIRAGGGLALVLPAFRRVLSGEAARLTEPAA